jgi:hypothetical protein
LRKGTDMQGSPLPDDPKEYPCALCGELGDPRVSSAGFGIVGVNSSGPIFDSGILCLKCRRKYKRKLPPAQNTVLEAWANRNAESLAAVKAYANGNFEALAKALAGYLSVERAAETATWLLSLK